jgi:hypothetical protein
VGRASLGSLSESVRIFDPEPLRQIAAELADQLPQPSQGSFDQIGKTLTAVDGSVIETIVRVARLAWLPKAGGKMNCGYRLHTQFEVFRGTVSRVDVTGSKPKGEADERALLASTVESDRCYLMDRGYAKFLLWNIIHAADSSYVCRVRDNSVYEVMEDKHLTEEDRKAGVISDQIVKFGSSKADASPDHTVRLVTVSASEHTSRGSAATGTSTGPSCDGKLRLATDVLDISAELIAEAYRLRWLIELFFRMFKQLLGCRHLLSTKQEGVEIQTYVAIIACLLILIHTGRAPTKRTFEMICLRCGWILVSGLPNAADPLITHAAVNQPQSQCRTLLGQVSFFGRPWAGCGFKPRTYGTAPDPLSITRRESTFDPQRLQLPIRLASTNSDPDKAPDLSDLLPDAWLKAHPEHRWEIDDIRKVERDRSRQQKISKRPAQGR